MDNHLIVKKLKILIISSIVGFILVGCAADPLNLSSRSKYAKNKDAFSFSTKKDYYQVKSGETLYSIAFKYGLDYKKLASLNGIPSPYVIYPNQKIRLSNSVAKKPYESKKPVKATTKPKKQIAKTNSSKTAPIQTKKTVKKSSNNTSKVNGKPLNWVWPIKGETLKGFSNKGVSSKGIDIKGRINDKVLSAANGVVVYAGNGLIGYGNLVIVKHNDEYLSAYAYNQKILVREKQSVKAGEQLAIIGSKGKEQSLLHFEVRKDGQPIDPLTVLPKTNK